MRKLTGGRQTRAVPADTLVYAIGDIHGRADLLADLLSRIVIDRTTRPERHARLIFLGDYIDRGPDSRAVIDTLMDRLPPGFDPTFLLGNHEETLLAFLTDPSVGPHWLAFGGGDTLASYGTAVTKSAAGEWAWDVILDRFRDDLSDRHLEFLSTLKAYEIVGDYFFVHAGIRPGVPIAYQSTRDLLWIRDDFLNSGTDHGFVVVHGHTPTDEPEVRDNRIGIDTGAYASGVLTALALSGETHWFVRTGEQA